MTSSTAIRLILVVLSVGAAALGAQGPASTQGARDATGLQPGLRAALDAVAAHGLRLSITSGRRSPAEQQRLLDEAIATYGSRAEAARWVASPSRSAHVSGDAVDLGPAAAQRWLAEHGAAYGLCRIYANEPWHFELRPAAVTAGCPAPYPDPTHDPRLQP